MPTFTPELLLSHLSPLPAARVGWIAYSGGLDSSVLLHALAGLRGRLAFELRALHLDHGLHRDSPTWAEHCAHTCERLGMPFQVRRLDLTPARGASLEEMARQARYESMAELLGADDLVLTAQHRDDQAETLLLALLRGSGPAGLAAMPPVAPLGRGRLVRPLLEFGRAELLTYAQARNLRWLEDPSNRDLVYDRNFLRHRVLPRLAERWPACAAGIARSAAHCAEAQAIIDPAAQKAMLQVAGQGPGTLSIVRLLDLELPLRKVVLRHWFRGQGRVPPDSRALGRILTEVMAARADANPLVAWPGCEVRRYRDDLFAMAPLPLLPAQGPIPWCQGILTLPDGLGCLELLAPDGRGLDPRDLFAPGLEIRFGVAGLACRRVRGGRRRPLKKLFQEQGVPPWVRPYVPLSFARDDLVAVGNRICRPEGVAWEREFQIRWKSDFPILNPTEATPRAVTAYLGIGGNLGDVRRTFSGALAALDATDGISVSGTSPLYMTPAVGGPEAQPPYLNAVIVIKTRLGACELLRRQLRIEADFARERTIRWGPRTLDLDLLLYGPTEQIADPPELMVPHPQLTERAFVLEPLTALAPMLIVPGTGCSVAALRDALPASERAGIRLVSPIWT